MEEFVIVCSTISGKMLYRTNKADTYLELINRRENITSDLMEKVSKPDGDFWNTIWGAFPCDGWTISQAKDRMLAQLGETPKCTLGYVR